MHKTNQATESVLFDALICGGIASLPIPEGLFASKIGNGMGKLIMGLVAGTLSWWHVTQKNNVASMFISKLVERQSSRKDVILLPGAMHKMVFLLDELTYKQGFTIYGYHHDKVEALCELFPSRSEIAQLTHRIEELDASQAVRKELGYIVERASSLPGDSYERGLIIDYIKSVLKLPWGKVCEQATNFEEALTALNANHYGFEDIKERILDLIAVRMYGAYVQKSPVVCLVGPPGVGKTSLAQSIATALNRPFIRIALGGMHDEADIRGKQRVYVGAMPGLIMKAINKVQCTNPVMLLDEVDKMGNIYSQGALAALLEILDPEQNSTYSDRYLEVPFDLSQVMYIATANNIADIPIPLRDRMDIIELSGYTREEKKNIAIHHLIPRALEKAGLDEYEDIFFNDEVLDTLINSYTAEAGVRELNRIIDSLCAKIARAIVQKDELLCFTAENIENYIDTLPFMSEGPLTQDTCGVAHGLAWTPIGGTLIKLQATITPGKGAINTTGLLGKVMKESAAIAISYVKEHAVALGIDPAIFAHSTIHFHIPAGGIGKDGPSAGATFAVALVSALTNRPMDIKYALTGEMDLKGNILPVGGIKEKLEAARRQGIQCVILPAHNKSDLKDPAISAGLTIYFANTIEDVLMRVLKK